MDMNLSKVQETVKAQGSLACCSSRGHKKSDKTVFYMSAYCSVNNGIIWYVTVNCRILGALVSALAHFSKKRSEPFWSLGGLAHSGICPALGGPMDRTGES